MQKILSKYKNGNYFVELYEDGTKIKYTKDEYFDEKRHLNLNLCTLLLEIYPIP